MVSQQLLNVVSHTPIETELLIKFINDSNWIDVGRKYFSKDEKLYSWWSYRNRDWKNQIEVEGLIILWFQKIWIYIEVIFKL